MGREKGRPAGTKEFSFNNIATKRIVPLGLIKNPAGMTLWVTTNKQIITNA